MNLKVTLGTLLVLVLAASLVFHFFQRQLSGAWFAFGVHPDVLETIDRSMQDQKRLARLDPGNAATYHRRFDTIRALQTRLRILAYNREEIVGRYEDALLALFGATIVLAGTGYAVRQVRQEARLARLQEALADLAAGRVDLAVGDRGRDLIGRIAAMIEETSQVMARDRRRLASLENLSAWQEAARRHAHEMRTPLTAARLELARLCEVAEAGAAGREELAPARDSVLQELDRLGRFTQVFTSFARLPQPRPVSTDLGARLTEFVETFAQAWPNLALRLVPPAAPVEAAVDREMLRQVLVNLCDNSSLAVRESGRETGTVTLTLGASGKWVLIDVADDGPGVPADLRGRLFEPYTTTRRIGEGMGLGLAISRKILLDHGGDLELLRTSEAGAVFRLTFPKSAPEAA